MEDYVFDNMDRLDLMQHFQSDGNNADLTDNALKNMFDWLHPRNVFILNKHFACPYGWPDLKGAPLPRTKAELNRDAKDKTGCVYTRSGG